MEFKVLTEMPFDNKYFCQMAIVQKLELMAP